LTEKVLIVGAGPAGAAAAIALARQGVGAILFEPAAAGGNKLFETLYPDAEALLDTLGLCPPEKKPLSVSYVGQDGDAKLKLSLDGSIGVVDRNELDRSLRKAALDAGAELVPTRINKVESSRDGVALYAQNDCFRGAYAIDASGKNAVTVTRSEWENSRPCLDNRFNAFCHFERAAGFDVGCSTIAALEGGFAYLLPISADRICIGVVSYADFDAANVDGTYSDLLGSSMFLSAFTRDAQRTLPVIPAKNVETMNAPLQDDRTFRVGDALGFTDPFLWDGLSFALGTGHLAGQLCGDAIVTGKQDFQVFSDHVKVIGDRVRRRTKGCCEDLAAKFSSAMAVDPHVSPILLACLFSITGAANSGGLDGLRGQLNANGHAK
jgi:flavin-dependent dehydrogenase